MNAVQFSMHLLKRLYEFKKSNETNITTNRKRVSCESDVRILIAVGGGLCYSKEISEFYGVEPTTIYAQARNLCIRGLLEQEDKFGYNKKLSLTPEGKKILHKFLTFK